MGVVVTEVGKAKVDNCTVGGAQAAKEGLEKKYHRQNAGHNQYNRLQMRNQHTQSQVHRHRTRHRCCKNNHLYRAGVIQALIG